MKMYKALCGKEFDAEAKVPAHARMCEKCKLADPKVAPEAGKISNGTSESEDAPTNYVKIPLEDMQRLSKALFTLSQLSCKGLFKFVSACGLSPEDMTEMDTTFRDLYNKYK